MNWEKLCPYFKFNLNKIKKNIAFQTYCNELDIPFPQSLIIYQQIGKKYFLLGKNEILSPKKNSVQSAEFLNIAKALGVENRQKKLF